VDATDLQVGDVLLLRGGRTGRVSGKIVTQVCTPVCNFGVEELECYAVGTSQILVHNNGCPPIQAGRKRTPVTRPDHTKNPSPSKRGKHEKGAGRKRRDQGHERKDPRMPYQR
jgi:hypothetical protein